ncbi:MAG: 50S ribosomal protein L19 [Clostridia bacterium]|nr:50S ribosomal protein L19 [Clostridia bacterium]
MDIIKSIEHEQLKNKIPELKVGNTVKVHVRIKEGNKERIQVFEGIIIKVQGGGVNQTFTVRKISYGVGVEKTFLVHSPLVEKVELVRVGKARRARLFYLRDRVGKSAKTKEQIGARIEDREIVIKEELAEEPVSEEVETKTLETAVETPAVEEKTEPVKEETKVVEEVKTESAPEEAPAVETENVAVQETVDTVKEEVVEDVKEEPAEAEKKDKE